MAHQHQPNTRILKLSEILGKPSDIMKDHRITIRLPDQMHRRLKVAAMRSGIRQSDTIRQAVERHFAAEDQELTAFQRTEQVGLIGAVKTAARDLSTNRRHFEGFGGS